MFGESRVNYSLDAGAITNYDELPSGITRGESLQDPRYFLDDTYYWDDQMFGISDNTQRVNFSISAADDRGYAEAVDMSVFLEY